MLVGLTDDLAQSIARMEGFTSGACTMCVANNNPCALRAGRGQVGTDGRGFAVFPGVDTGWSACNRQVDLNIARGLTLQEFFAGKPGVYAGFAPASDRNNPGGYASTVAGWLGLAPDAVLASVDLGYPPDDYGDAAEPLSPDSAISTPLAVGLALGAAVLLSSFFAD